jgi:hypothetical protein
MGCRSAGGGLGHEAMAVRRLGGAIGVLATEAVSMSRAIQNHKCLPWHVEDEVSFGPWLTGLFVRCAAGIAFALILGGTGPLNPLAAATAGITAPLGLDKLGKGETAESHPVERKPRSAQLEARAAGER